MPQEREKKSLLTVTEYDIVGNSFRAWCGADGRVRFVVDDTIDDYKPNVLLVVGDDGGRKWDEILVDDFNVDLETVRPRRDNKYQKLDVEYEGVQLYENLIAAYESGDDVDEALANLWDWRDAAVRRAATERLNAAEDTIILATNTISRTRNAIRNQRTKLRFMRNKLTEQKEMVGREPTKESAAKILRSEARIERLIEKIARAEKRIENAQHRIETAEADADAARALLNRRRSVSKVQKHGALAVPNESALVPVRDGLPVPDYEIKTETQLKPREEKMADEEEVKPLFDKDPEILDDEIAFKPVEFDDIKSRADKDVKRPEPPVREESREEPVALSDDDLHDYAETDSDVDNARLPVIESIDSVDKPEPADVDTTGTTDNTQYGGVRDESGANVQNRPVQNVAAINRPVSSTVATRPMSPITGGEVRPVGGNHSKPTFAYYLLLILLIALSIFTLWLYQKKNGGTVPFIGAGDDSSVVSEPDVLVPGEPASSVDTVPEPVTVSEPVAPQPEPVSQFVPEPEPVYVPAPAPVVEAPIKIEYPNNDVLRAAEPEAPVVESEEEVLARKDVYGVSPTEKTVVRVTNVTAPDVIYDDDVISVPVRTVDVDSQEYYDDGMNDAGYYYEAPAQYDVPEYEYNDYIEDAGSFVDQNAKFGASDSDTRHELSIHDGGQYSISYDETNIY